MRMRTLHELAETYERWAEDAEALANRIMVLSSQSGQAQVRQQESVGRLLQEAERLRLHAARLRQTPDCQNLASSSPASSSKDEATRH